MKTNILSLSIALLFLAGCKKETVSVNDVSDLEAYYKNYQSFIDSKQYDSVANLYDRSGAVIYDDEEVPKPMPFDSIQKKFKEPILIEDFRWKNLVYRKLDENNAFVTGNYSFVYNLKQKKWKISFLYTGVLSRKDGKWYIQHELEAPDLKSSAEIHQYIDSLNQARKK